MKIPEKCDNNSAFTQYLNYGSTFARMGGWNVEFDRMLVLETELSKGWNGENKSEMEKLKPKIKV